MTGVDVNYQLETLPEIDEIPADGTEDEESDSPEHDENEDDELSSTEIMHDKQSTPEKEPKRPAAVKSYSDSDLLKSKKLKLYLDTVNDEFSRNDASVEDLLEPYSNVYNPLQKEDDLMGFDHLTKDLPPIESSKSGNSKKLKADRSTSIGGTKGPAKWGMLKGIVQTIMKPDEKKEEITKKIVDDEDVFLLFENDFENKKVCNAFTSLCYEGEPTHTENGFQDVIDQFKEYAKKKERYFKVIGMGSSYHNSKDIFPNFKEVHCKLGCNHERSSTITTSSRNTIRTISSLSVSAGSIDDFTVSEHYPMLPAEEEKQEAGEETNFYPVQDQVAGEESSENIAISSILNKAQLRKNSIQLLAANQLNPVTPKWNNARKDRYLARFFYAYNESKLLLSDRMSMYSMSSLDDSVQKFFDSPNWMRSGMDRMDDDAAFSDNSSSQERKTSFGSTMSTNFQSIRRKGFAAANDRKFSAASITSSTSSKNVSFSQQRKTSFNIVDPFDPQSSIVNTFENSCSGDLPSVIYEGSDEQSHSTRESRMYEKFDSRKSSFLFVFQSFFDKNKKDEKTMTTFETMGTGNTDHVTSVSITSDLEKNPMEVFVVNLVYHWKKNCVCLQRKEDRIPVDDDEDEESVESKVLPIFRGLLSKDFGIEDYDYDLRKDDNKNSAFDTDSRQTLKTYTSRSTLGGTIATGDSRRMPKKAYSFKVPAPITETDENPVGLFIRNFGDSCKKNLACMHPVGEDFHINTGAFHIPDPDRRSNSN